MSIPAFALMAHDKQAAGRGRQRIPEKSLIVMAWIGGAPGVLLGMLHFRHKLSKAGFKSLVIGAFIVQLAVLFSVMPS